MAPVETSPHPAIILTSRLTPDSYAWKRGLLPTIPIGNKFEESLVSKERYSSFEKSPQTTS